MSQEHPSEFALAQELVVALREQDLKVATAESCTGGRIAGAITSVPGASSVFEYGWVTYANAAKMSQLGVPEAAFVSEGAVSKSVVCAMALGALERSHAMCAVAVSGIAGPEGGTRDKPVGTVWVAWAFLYEAERVVRAEKFLFQNRDRELFRSCVVQVALRGVLSWVRGKE